MVMVFVATVVVVFCRSLQKGETPSFRYLRIPTARQEHGSKRERRSKQKHETWYDWWSWSEREKGRDLDLFVLSSITNQVLYTVIRLCLLIIKRQETPLSFFNTRCTALDPTKLVESWGRRKKEFLISLTAPYSSGLDCWTRLFEQWNSSVQHDGTVLKQISARVVETRETIVVQFVIRHDQKLNSVG